MWDTHIEREGERERAIYIKREREKEGKRGELEMTEFKQHNVEITKERRYGTDLMC